MPDPKSLLLITLLSGGCAFSSPRQWQTAQTPTKPVGTVQPARTPAPVQSSMQQQAGPEPNLYARDGSVVGENRVPVERAAQGRKQKLENDESSRSTILEWYQAALEERDALQLEVRALHTDLATTRESLRLAESRGVELEARVQALEADNQESIYTVSELGVLLCWNVVRAQPTRRKPTKHDQALNELLDQYYLDE